MQPWLDHHRLLKPRLAAGLFYGHLPLPNPASRFTAGAFVVLTLSQSRLWPEMSRDGLPPDVEFKIW